MSKRLSKEEILERARKVHGDRYDYSLIEDENFDYKSISEKFPIVCKKHGVVPQIMRNHLNGAGCRLCADEVNAENFRKSTDKFIEDAIAVHGNKYDYSMVEYKNWKTEVTIRCNKCGHVFKQSPNAHLSGQGCKKCGREAMKAKRRLTIDDFVKRCKKIHGDDYDYSLVEYVNSGTNVMIKCKKCGFIFPQTPENHLHKTSPHGCPRCSMSHLERGVEKLLTDNNIKFDAHYTPDFFKNKYMHLDFYLPDYNIGIECQGIQHFKPITIFGGDKEFEKRTKLDEEKYKWCEENGVRMVYVAKPSDMKLIDESKISSIYKNGIIQEVNGILENIL